MKYYNNVIGGRLLLIEESDLKTNLLSRLRGNRVDYVIAPKSAKEYEGFLLQVEACVSIQSVEFGKVLYYDVENNKGELSN